VNTLRLITDPTTQVAGGQREVTFARDPSDPKDLNVQLLHEAKAITKFPIHFADGQKTLQPFRGTPLSAGCVFMHS
jgi:hypothetical protein